MHYRNGRRGWSEPKRKTPENGSPGAHSESGKNKSVGYPTDIGKTQPKDRSLGMPRVRTRVEQKGL